jgi:hypothetical protein
MLGMRALTEHDPDLAWRSLLALKEARDRRMQLGIIRRDTGESIGHRVHSLIFSDTLIAFSEGNTESDAMALLIVTAEVLVHAISFCIPLRGGIAHGRFRFDPDVNLFSGPALVDAYALGESSQWIGVTVDGHTAGIVKSSPLCSGAGMDPIVQWDVPMKDGTSPNRHVVNWAQTHRANYRGTVPLTVEAFYSPLVTAFGPLETLAPSTRSKYENTVEFFNAHYRANDGQGVGVSP